MGLLDEAIRDHLELKRKHGASDQELQQQEQEALGPVRREPAETPAAADEASAEETAPDDAVPEPAETQVDEVLADSEVLEDAEAPVAASAVDVAPDPVDEAPDVVAGTHDVVSDTDELVSDTPEAAAEPAEAVDDVLEEVPEELVEEPVADPAAESFQEPAAPFSEPAPEGEAGTELLEPDDELEPLGAGDTPSRGFGPVEDPLADEPELADDPLPAAEGEDEGEDVLEETPEFLEETPEHDRLWFEQKPPRDFEFDE